jgi:hypothetical protein
MRIVYMVVAALLACACVQAAEPELPEVIVYKDPQCGCCSNWVTHMRDNRFAVTAVDVDNIASYKQKYGVPSHLSSCHTAVSSGYFIEGHVPAADVIKLLADRPDILGLSVPGMPVGAPGMEMGNRMDNYEVVAVRKDGSVYTYSTYGATSTAE